MVTTRSWPRAAAARMEVRMSSACLAPIVGFGCSGLPLQFKPASDTPVPSNRARYLLAAAGSTAISAISGMCTGGRKPPELTSMPSSPRPAMTASASSSGRSCRIAL